MKRGLSLALAGILLITLLLTSVGQVAPAPNANAPGRKIVVFSEHVAPAAQDAMINRAGAAKVKNLRLVNAAVVMATPAAEKALARFNGVLWVEDDAVATIVGQPDAIFNAKPTKPAKPPKPGGGDPPPPPPEELPWGVDRIDAEQVWNTSTGVGVKVAVIDTGIDLKHPDLGVAGGVNAINRKKAFNDDNGHGSHVAGIIAARNNEIGVVGVAPGVELYAVKVLGPVSKRLK